VNLLYVCASCWRQDHSKPEFIEQRRQALTQYLVALSRIPRMASNLDFLLFLGISNDICEKVRGESHAAAVSTVGLTGFLCPLQSVIFLAGPLGMTLKGQRVGSQLFVEVAAFKNNDDGSKGQAELSNQISIGDKYRQVSVVLPWVSPTCCACGVRLSKINGDNVLGESYEVVIARIKAAHRPLVVHFLGMFPDPSSHPADVASGFGTIAPVSAVSGGSSWSTPAPVPITSTPAPAPAYDPFGDSEPAPAPAPAAKPAPTAADLDLL
jgi:hypothetical protein